MCDCLILCSSQVSWVGDIATSFTTSLHILVFCALRWLSMAKPHIFTQIKVIHAQVSYLFGSKFLLKPETLFQLSKPIFISSKKRLKTN